MSIERQNRAAVSTDSAAANGDARVRKRARDASRRRRRRSEDGSGSCRHSPHGLFPAPAMPISFLFSFPFPISGVALFFFTIQYNFAFRILFSFLGSELTEIFKRKCRIFYLFIFFP